MDESERLDELDKLIRLLYAKRGPLLEKVRGTATDQQAAEELHKKIDNLEDEIDRLEGEEADLLWRRAKRAKRERVAQTGYQVEKEKK